MGIRLFSGLTIGKESLESHGAAITAIADNLANQNTTAFKAERAEFETLLAEGMGNLFGTPVQGFNGVSVGEFARPQTQGAIQQTGRALDFGIEGNGYFVTTNGTNTFYTRAGNFSTDPDSNLVTADGDIVMGFTAESPTTPVPLNIGNVTSAATPTTTATLSGNLDSRSALTVPVAAPASFNELNAAASFSTSFQIFDSLGDTHDIGVYFFHTETSGWTAQAWVDGGDVGGVAEVPTLLGEVPMTFDTSGLQPADAVTQIAITPAWINGSAATPITVDVSAFTGLAGTSNLSSVVSDGNSSGSVVSFEADEDGTLLARLDNGTTVSVGQLALANFANPEGLQRQGDNRYIADDDSGDALVGAPGTEGRGVIKGASLEGSNVDPARELIDLIRFQRGYQAGSTIISTVNEMLERTIQLA